MVGKAQSSPGPTAGPTSALGICCLPLEILGDDQRGLDLMLVLVSASSK